MNRIGSVKGGRLLCLNLTLQKSISYRLEEIWLLEMSGATVDDQIPEIRDSHEASQDQAEEAADEKDKARAEVKPLESKFETKLPLSARWP